jgi:hypothetical protein
MRSKGVDGDEFSGTAGDIFSFFSTVIHALFGAVMIHGCPSRSI